MNNRGEMSLQIVSFLGDNFNINDVSVRAEVEEIMHLIHNQRIQ